MVTGPLPNLFERFVISVFQFYVLAWEETRVLIFRRRALFAVLLYALLVGALVAAVAWVEARLTAQISSIGDPAKLEQLLAAQMDELGLRHEYAVVRNLFRLPGGVVVFHLFSLLWYPTMVGLISCDMIATDIYRGTLRFLLVRTGRTVYFLSKTASHIAFYVLLQLASIAALLLTCRFTASDFNWSSYCSAAFTLFCAFMPFLFFLVATTQFVSCLGGKPARTVLKLHVFWLLFIVLAVIVPVASPFSGNEILGLMAPFAGYGRHSVILFSTWACGFLLAGLLFFRRRSV